VTTPAFIYGMTSKKDNSETPVTEAIRGFSRRRHGLLAESEHSAGVTVTR
jgi:hypothetical protein